MPVRCTRMRSSLPLPGCIPAVSNTSSSRSIQHRAVADSRARPGCRPRRGRPAGSERRGSAGCRSDRRRAAFPRDRRGRPAGREGREVPGVRRYRRQLPARKSRSFSSPSLTSDDRTAPARSSEGPTAFARIWSGPTLLRGSWAATYDVHAEPRDHEGEVRDRVAAQVLEHACFPLPGVFGCRLG